MLRSELAKHVQKIRLKPMIRTYFATGTWDFLGVLGSEAAMVMPECDETVIQILRYVFFPLTRPIWSTASKSSKI
jgi:hypothetical protein